MPVVLPMKSRMSRRLALVNRTCSGSRDDGLSSGSAVWRRASSRIASMGALGICASMRWRIMRSSSAARPTAGRFLPSYSTAVRYSASASSSWSTASSSRPLA